MTVPDLNAGPSRRIFLLAQPRTTSYLLVRMLGLEKQPNVHWDEDEVCTFFRTRKLMTALGLSTKPVTEWTKDERVHVQTSFQQCFHGLDQYLANGEANGKIVIAKEHCNFLWSPCTRIGIDHTSSDGSFNITLPPTHAPSNDEPMGNPTVLPTEYLGTWRPIFLIRHPALAFPSYCRGVMRIQESNPIRCDPEYLLKDLQLQMSFYYTRSLYDWYIMYCGHKGDTANSIAPVLLDADDIINDPEIVCRLAKLLGLDESSVQYSWTPRTDKDAFYLKKAFMQTLNASSGVQKDKTSASLDIGDEIRKWKVEFGESLGELIENCVSEAMPDYEYLKSKRLQSGCVLF
ncbi:hypothetical protein Asppvi_010088 [Aspergillus pseudoviridinutans]|uniref:P-loop containing nucleoside triphosphate hydrolase protein n=1 Tax=Aspergillus pseudoviridinutans TaxID=1517512 RepID=A0A9P3BLF5_9EURO|nr:uncharacterized protein Asppvi_010088 [Aspergillus pseudoviridinutans]GIJ91123.1 hypothetical protein Asppvi_010088 [Aspergillus pseudoviridinutans]